MYRETVPKLQVHYESLSTGDLQHCFSQTSKVNEHTHMKMARRKNYSREFKLEVVGLYHTSNLYRTKNQYNLNTKTILRWVKQERELILSKRGSKRLKGSRKATLPKLEERLIKEIDQQRQKGLRVKRWWIISRAKQINKEISGRTDGQPENIMPPAPSVRRHKKKKNEEKKITRKKKEDKF